MLLLKLCGRIFFRAERDHRTGGSPGLPFAMLCRTSAVVEAAIPERQAKGALS